MAKYGERMIRDLPQQFRGKDRIEALFEVIGKQLDQVQEFYNSLNIERALTIAQGEQLDRIGSILVLTRAEAGLLIQDNEDYVVDDDTYRYILAYKIMLNNGSATYYDIVRGIKKFYDLEIQYSESPDEPATFMLEVGAADANIPLRHILPVKAAGVLCYYRFRLGGDRDAIKVSTELDTFKYSLIECGNTFCGMHWKRATIGNTDNFEIGIDRSLTEYGYEPDLTGTLPDIATFGQTEGFVINSNLEVQAFDYHSLTANTTQTGIVPQKTTSGYSMENVNLTINSIPEGFTCTTIECGATRAGTKTLM